MADIVGPNTYNDDSIQTLEWNEHIRRRAGMYIGRLGYIIWSKFMHFFK